MSEDEWDKLEKIGKKALETQKKGKEPSKPKEKKKEQKV